MLARTFWSTFRAPGSKLDHVWPKFGQVWPKSARVGQNRSDVSQLFSNFGKHGRCLRPAPRNCPQNARVSNVRIFFGHFSSFWGLVAVAESSGEHFSSIVFTIGARHAGKAPAACGRGPRARRNAWSKWVAQGVSRNVRVDPGVSAKVNRNPKDNTNNGVVHGVNLKVRVVHGVRARVSLTVRGCPWGVCEG